VEGLGTAILIVAVGGILLLVVLAIEVAVLIRRLRQPDLCPDQRGWLLMGGSLLVATAAIVVRRPLLKLDHCARRAS
jgi:hypothetical protein